MKVTVLSFELTINANAAADDYGGAPMRGLSYGSVRLNLAIKR